MSQNNPYTKDYIANVVAILADELFSGVGYVNANFYDVLKRTRTLNRAMFQRLRQQQSAALMKCLAFDMVQIAKMPYDLSEWQADYNRTKNTTRYQQRLQGLRAVVQSYPLDQLWEE